MKDIEKYLSRFNLKEPPPELKRKIIPGAVKFWNDQGDDLELSPCFRIGIKIFFPAAAAIIIAILFLNAVMFSRSKVNAEKHRLEVKRLVELGISKDRAEIMVAAEKNRENEFILYTNNLPEDDS